MHSLIQFTRSARRVLCTGVVVGLAAGAFASPIQETKPESQPAKEVAKDLPKAGTLLKAARDAMGGVKAMKAVESIYSRAEMDIPMMQGKMVMESRWAKPGKILITQTVPGQGSMEMGYDGEVGWMNMGPMRGGYRLMEGPMVDQFKDRSNMHMMLMEIEKEMETIETVDQVSFDERPCFKIHMVEKAEKTESGEPESDPAESWLYVDAETKLPAGLEAREMGQGMTIKFSDWKPVGDVKMFRTMRIVDPGGMEMEMVYTLIELNKVDLQAFELPDEVKKLVEEQKAGDEKPSTQPGGAAPPGTGPLTDDDKAKLDESMGQILSQEPSKLREMLGVIEHQAKSATGERDRATFEYIAKRIREHLEKLDKEKGEKDKDKDKGGI